MDRTAAGLFCILLLGVACEPEGTVGRESGKGAGPPEDSASNGNCATATPEVRRVPVGSHIGPTRLVEIAPEVKFLREAGFFRASFSCQLWDGRMHVPVSIAVRDRAVIGKYGDAEWVTRFAHVVIGLQAGDVGATEAGELFKLELSSGEVTAYIDDFGLLVRAYLKLHDLLSAGATTAAMAILTDDVQVENAEPVREFGPLNVRAFMARRNEKVELRGVGIDAPGQVVVSSRWCAFWFTKLNGEWRVVHAFMRPDM